MPEKVAGGRLVNWDDPFGDLTGATDPPQSTPAQIRRHGPDEMCVVKCPGCDFMTLPHPRRGHCLACDTQLLARWAGGWVYRPTGTRTEALCGCGEPLGGRHRVCRRCSNRESSATWRAQKAAKAAA